MERKLEYSFDDEVANKFCYDMENKKIKFHFRGYFYDAIIILFINFTNFTSIFNNSIKHYFTL